MPGSVRVLVQVPRDLDAFEDALEAHRRYGTVRVYDVSDEGVAAGFAERHGLEFVRLPWDRSYADVFNRMLEDRPGEDRLLLYADEFPREPRGAVDLRAHTEAASVRVSHRTGERRWFAEEHECRWFPAHSPVRFAGRFPFGPVDGNGDALDPSRLPLVPLLLEHYPARYLGLSDQRVRRTVTAYEADLEERPDDPGVLYGLLHCHVSLRQWGTVRALGERFDEIHDRAAPELAALVDYHVAAAAVSLRDLAEALERARRAVSRSPAFADAWYLLGELAVVRRDLQEAERCFTRALEIGPQAEPVAVEDLRLATYEPARRLADLAERRGDLEERDRLRARADALLAS